MSNQESFLSVKHWRNFLNERKKCGPGETWIPGTLGYASGKCVSTEELESFIANPPQVDISPESRATRKKSYIPPPKEDYIDAADPVGETPTFGDIDVPPGAGTSRSELAQMGILFNQLIDLDNPYFAMPARFNVNKDDITYDEGGKAIDAITGLEVPEWLQDVLMGNPIGWMQFNDVQGIKVLPKAVKKERTWGSPMTFMQLNALGGLGTEQGYPYYVEDVAELKDTGNMLRLGQKVGGHDSHGSGRDFDISIPLNPNVLPSGQSIKKDGSGFLKKWSPLLNAENLDVARALAVIRHFSPTSQKIAIDKRYHPALRKHARELKENGVMSQSEYNTIFKSGQLVSWGGGTCVKRDPDTGECIKKVRNKHGNHANHFHIRLKPVHAMKKLDYSYTIEAAKNLENLENIGEKPFWEYEDHPTSPIKDPKTPDVVMPPEHIHVKTPRTRPTRTRKQKGARLPVDTKTGKTRAWTPEELEILRSLDESQKIINIVNEQMPGMDPAAQRLQMQKQVIQMQLGPIITQALDFIFTLGSLDDPAAANQSSMYENRVESIIRDFNDGKMEPQEASVSLGRVVDEMGRKVQKFMS